MLHAVSSDGAQRRGAPHSMVRHGAALPSKSLLASVLLMCETKRKGREREPDGNSLITKCNIFTEAHRRACGTNTWSVQRGNVRRPYRSPPPLSVQTDQRVEFLTCRAQTGSLFCELKLAGYEEGSVIKVCVWCFGFFFLLFFLSAFMCWVLSFLLLMFLLVALYSKGPFSDRHCKYAASINAVVCGVDLFFFLFLYK